MPAFLHFLFLLLLFPEEATIMCQPTRRNQGRRRRVDPTPKATRPLHRLHAVRQQQGISIRKVARTLHISQSQVRDQEEPTSDLRLSSLYQWQEVLDVPIAELLVESERPLSRPVLERARLLRLMKTAVSIMERAEQVSVRRLAETMVAQLTELMPELETVSGWHAVGQRRTLDEYGQTALRVVPERLVLGY